ncbi:MAG: glycosyltransferase [Acidimicrobiia bacterium]
MSPSVTVLAPAYNEEAVIGDFVATVVDALEPGWGLLVVDDGSRDGTKELLRRLAGEYPALRVITHDHNQGVGAALRTGFAGATGDIVVTMDADLSHPVDLIARLVDECGQASAAFASRFVAGGSMEGVPAMRRWMSAAGNLVFRLMFLSPVRDLTTGFRAYRREALADIKPSSTGFEVQLELAVLLISRHETIVEVPLQLANRAAGTSKMRYLPLISTYAKAVARLLVVRWRHLLSQGTPES